MELKTVVPMLTLVLVLGFVLTLPSTGRPPLVHPDPPQDCMGPSDPFCAPGGGTSCKICQFIGNPVHTISCKVDSTGQGDTCEIEWSGDSASCSVTGSC